MLLNFATILMRFWPLVEDVDIYEGECTAKYKLEIANRIKMLVSISILESVRAALTTFPIGVEVGWLRPAPMRAGSNVSVQHPQSVQHPTK